MGAATIRIFLADGTPHGIRIVDKSSWTGRGVEFARVDWPRARTRDDFCRPGVYVLTGEADDGLMRVQDFSFNSPSTAAAVLLGRISNGRVEWRDAAGTPLKTLQESQAG